MVEDIVAQLAAIRRSLDAEFLKDELHATAADASGIARSPVRERNEIETENGLTKRNALCPCGSGRRFKHCHGQHQTLTKVEEPLQPQREISSSTTIEISGVEITKVERLSIDISRDAHGNLPGALDALSGEDAESLHPEVELSSVGDMTGLVTDAAERRKEPEVVLGERKMPRALEMIVAGHVKMKSRHALADLLAHRRKVLREVQAVSGIDTASLVRTILEEIALVESRLEELKPLPGALPENEWT